MMLEQRQDLYGLLADDVDRDLRFHALHELGMIFDGGRDFRSIADDEWPPHLSPAHVRDHGIPRSQLPAPRRLIINPSRVPDDQSARNDVKLDTFTLLATRYYLLAAETLYAKVRADGLARAYEFLLHRDATNPFAVTDRLPLVAPLAGAAATALVDRNPKANLLLARQHIADDHLAHPQLWRFPGYDKPPHWDTSQEQEAAVRELARLWIAADQQPALRHHRVLSELETLIITRSRDSSHTASRPHHRNTDASGGSPKPYRTPLPSDYQPTATVVADFCMLRARMQGKDATADPGACLGNLRSFIDNQLNAGTTRPIGGIAYLDPIPPQALYLVAQLLAAGDQPHPDIQEWFSCLQLLYRHHFWQCLPAVTRHLWTRTIEDLGLDTDPTRWRDILSRGNPYLRIPIATAVTELETLVEDLAQAVHHGADLPPTNSDLQPVIDRLQMLQLQIKSGRDNVPVSNAPDGWEQLVAVRWLNDLEPAFRGLRGNVTWQPLAEVAGRFHVKDPRATLDVILNRARGELTLYLDLPTPERAEQAPSWQHWLEQLYEARQTPEVMNCGVTVRREDVVDKLPDRLALTATISVATSTADDLVRAVTGLASHPLATNPTPAVVVDHTSSWELP